MPGLSRREFLKRTVAAGAIGGMVLSGADKLGAAEAAAGQFGTFIDLTRCDGCKDLETPRCVSACRREKTPQFPQPAEHIEYYWPRKKKEDWSGKKQLTNRLTPYNWSFVQTVKVEHQGEVREIHLPRRCMHCDNPPCANLCPFGAQSKSPEGPVLINKELCLGGAKCRDVCPWGIPARQAGVGLYMKIAPKYLGAGVMYKCDLCYSRITAGRPPACVESCHKKAVVFGEKEEMRALAHQKARKIGGFIYGETENGGTSTFYVSPVPFTKIHKQLMDQKAEQPVPDAPGFPGMPPGVDNFLNTANGAALGMLVAPVAGVVAAGFAAYKTMKGEKQ
ncbi:4Fe-4S dicluster domain-containing protein [Desulforudis sp. 1088]|uniref:4Fe-4S dicluster domain-containing protein n=1 Tax=unclassified Candidatus Desulforudis TaxID=2635950 RepID=UPI003CE48ABE